MDITPQQSAQQPISDDQELAKALAGVMPGVEQPAAAPQPSNDDHTTSNSSPEMKFEETETATAPTPTDAQPATSSLPMPGTSTPPSEEAAPATPPAPAQDAASGTLDAIKKDALQELRPLMDKVELPAEEKFDTYLMLIRSTDDAELIAPAHTAAAAIADEKRRAEALLEIIKEIDYLSRDKKPAQQ
ncbi:MAG TPA: hypothetical protein QF549_02350 [Candidatus Saccharimonadaceae bacterium]|nr:hypothetical protein [Candidatus Saccharimonadaceae bacterium]|tara:strand:- start:1851 stop:2414 length:564 start_codon:yes stop_codon:yes gene_type:complete